jgi:hypothetical protein
VPLPWTNEQPEAKEDDDQEEGGIAKKNHFHLLLKSPQNLLEKIALNAENHSLNGSLKEEIVHLLPALVFQNANISKTLNNAKFAIMKT